MRAVRIEVKGVEAALSQFKAAWHGAARGEPAKRPQEVIGFADLDTLQRILTSARWALIRVLQVEGPMGVRELARRLERDVKNVHTDLRKLKEVGLVEDAPDGGVWVPFDEIKTEFVVRRAA